MKKLLAAIVFSSLLLPAGSAAIFAAEGTQAAPAAVAAAPSEPATLPKDIVWETDNDEALIGSEKAIRGGALNVSIDAYPLTFRTMGPNSNDEFASWNDDTSNFHGRDAYTSTGHFR